LLVNEGLLQQLLAKQLIGQHPLQPRVFLLQFFELLRRIEVHHPELALPTVEGLLADARLTADIHNARPGRVSLAKNADLWFRCRSFASFHLGPF